MDSLLFEDMFSQLDRLSSFLRALDWTPSAQVEGSPAGGGQVSTSTRYVGRDAKDAVQTRNGASTEPCGVYKLRSLGTTILASVGPLPEVPPGLGEAGLCSGQGAVTAE